MTFAFADFFAALTKKGGSGTGGAAADAAQSAANHGLANETASAGASAASHGAAAADAKAASDATGSSAPKNTQGGRLQDKLPDGNTALKVGGAAYVANTVKDMGKNVDKQFGEIGEVIGGCEGKTGKDLEDCKKKGKAYVYIGFGVLLILMLR